MQELGIIVKRVTSLPSLMKEKQVQGTSYRGECCGRGDNGSPTIRECLFPRSDVVTATFSPLLAEMCCALDGFATGVLGDSGSVIRIPAGLEHDDSTVASFSVVSVPLSSCIEDSSPSDWASSAAAGTTNISE